jgi:hypothetical protein
VTHVVLVDRRGIVEGDGELLDELDDGGLVARTGGADGHSHSFTLLLAVRAALLAVRFGGGRRLPLAVTMTPPARDGCIVRISGTSCSESLAVRGA